MVKAVVWMGSARKDMRGFPDGARGDAGSELYQVQLGRQPRDWRPMPTVGPGAKEIRVRSGGGGGTEHRVVYVANFPEAVYVLHAFQKTTRKTSRKDIETARSRYQDMVALRTDH